MRFVFFSLCPLTISSFERESDSFWRENSAIMIRYLCFRQWLPASLFYKRTSCDSKRPLCCVLPHGLRFFLFLASFCPRVVVVFGSLKLDNSGFVQIFLSCCPSFFPLFPLSHSGNAGREGKFRDSPIWQERKRKPFKAKEREFPENYNPEGSSSLSFFTMILTINLLLLPSLLPWTVILGPSFPDSRKLRVKRG